MRIHFLVFLVLVLTGCQSSHTSSDIEMPKSSDGPSPAATASPTPEKVPEVVANEPQLLIELASQEKVWTRKELLEHEALREMTITDHSAYEDQERTYKALPLALLFEGMKIPEDGTLEYQTKDGFSSSMEVRRLLNRDQKGSVAFLAVEEEANPWPRFENRTYGPGPFYVIWPNPELSEIGREEWPFKLTGFRLKSSLEKRYPKLPPSSSVALGSPVYQGYKLFIKNCFPCHQLDRQGKASFGPDLGYPLNATEYMKRDMLKKYIRDPQSVRQWKNGKMPAFPEKEISDEDIENIVLFLEHKAQTR